MITALWPLLFLFSANSAAQQVDLSDSVAKRKTERFYDSVYRKMDRNRITRMLYPLAFIKPSAGATDSISNVQPSESPYDSLQGKIVGRIRVITQDPFGTSIYDTTENALTEVGKFLNKLHIRTIPNVIRSMLLFRPGDTLNSYLLSDNLRIIKELGFMDDAKYSFMPVSPGSDTMNVWIITKDVWSIGADIPVVTTRRAVIRLYDGNFLGLGDRLQVSTSAELNRAPFMQIDGVSYFYNNIAGSFVNASIAFSQDNTGTQSVTMNANRSFISIRTKFAGGTGFSWNRYAFTINDSVYDLSWYNDYGLWAGRSFLFNEKKSPWRFVLTQGFYFRNYTSRPLVTIDTNRGFYNSTRLLTGLAVSRNNYYLAHYFYEFGKAENIPHGYLIQCTFGPDIVDFYTRFYVGISISGGLYLEKLGYFSAYFKSSILIRKNSFEDGTCKINLHYFTPLYTFARQRYKIRIQFTGDYRTGFNLRNNNPDYIDLTNLLNIHKVNEQNPYLVQQAMAISIIPVLFTPWNLYGFKFALLARYQGSLFSKENIPLIRSGYLSSLSVGLIIKNDNLIFPSFMIGGIFYLNAPGINQFQPIVGAVPNYSGYDFNVVAPYEETLGN